MCDNKDPREGAVGQAEHACIFGPRRARQATRSDEAINAPNARSHRPCPVPGDRKGLA